MQSKLIHLNLSHNLVSIIGASAFNGLHSLKTLDLSNNLVSFKLNIYLFFNILF